MNWRPFCIYSQYYLQFLVSPPSCPHSFLLLPFSFSSLPKTEIPVVFAGISVLGSGGVHKEPRNANYADSGRKINMPPKKAKIFPWNQGFLNFPFYNYPLSLYNKDLKSLSRRSSQNFLVTLFWVILLSLKSLILRNRYNCLMLNAISCRVKMTSIALWQ